MMHSQRLRSGLIGIVAIVMLGVAACSSGTSTETTTSGQAIVSSTTTSAGSTTTTSAGSTETTVAATTTAPPVVGWVRVPDEEGALGGDDRQSINAVTAGGPGVVAVGVDGFQGGAVWTSPDGLTWTRVPDDGGVFSSVSGTTINAVTAGGPGVVAVGGNQDGAVAWTSADGTAWSVVSDPAEYGGVMMAMHGVIATDSGLIAVGERYTPEDGYGAAVWTSTDGLTWTRLPDTAEIRPAGVGAFMEAITSGGPGFVAVGGIHGDDDDAAVWTSADGSTWTRVPDDGTLFGGPGDQSMRAVTAGGPGLVAVGYDTSTDEVGAAVWTSPDGLSWTRIPSTLEVFDGSDARGMWGVTADGDGLVAVGAVGNGSAIWESADGSVWTRVPQNDGEFDADGGVIHGIAHAGPGLVAAGQEYLSGDPDAAVWVKSTSN